MFLKFILVLIYFVVLQILFSAGQSCTLSKKLTDLEKGLFLKENSGQTTSLLRQEIVQLNEEIHLICQNNVLYTAQCGVTNFNNLQTSNCASYDLQINKLYDPQNNNNLIAYDVGFQTANTFLRLFITYYDYDAKIPKYTESESYKNSHNGIRDCISFRTGGVLPGALLSAYANNNVIQKITDLYGQNAYGPVGNKIYIIERGHLAPCIDFLFQYEKRASSLLFNLVPQFATINNGNWKQMEGWVHDYLTKRNIEMAKIVTGAFGVLELKVRRRSLKRKFYLYGTRELPVPEWMYKAIHYENGDKYVFLVYNNVYDNNEPVLPSACNRITTMPFTFEQDKIKGFMYRCDPITFQHNMNTVYHHNWNIF